jgi:hypothetical protein
MRIENNELLACPIGLDFSALTSSANTTINGGIVGGNFLSANTVGIKMPTTTGSIAGLGILGNNFQGTTDSLQNWSWAFGSYDSTAPLQPGDESPTFAFSGVSGTTPAIYQLAVHDGTSDSTTKIAPAGTTLPILGVYLSATAAGGTARLAVNGITKCTIDGTVTRGDRLCVSASTAGRAVSCTGAQDGFAVAMASGVAADNVLCALEPSAPNIMSSYGTVPAYRATGTIGTGTSTVGSGQGLGLPTGHVTNDLLILTIQSQGGEAGTCPAGYTQIGPQKGTGTGALSTRLTACWKRDGGAESVPTVADAGDHTTASISAFSGVVTTGDPFVYLGGGVKATASTSVAAPGGSTSQDNTLVVIMAAHGIDSASAQYTSPLTNADLASITERQDEGSVSGTGGGLTLTTGTKLIAGSIGTTTGTVGSAAEAYATIALLPVASVQPSNASRGPDVQTFTSPGGSQTWNKPTGARLVEIVAIGGGGGGGEGRSVATAAGGGGGGGGAYQRVIVPADQLQSTMTVTVGTAGVGAGTQSAGTASTVVDNSLTIVSAGGGAAGVDAATGDGGNGGAGGSVNSLAVAAGGTCTGSSTVCQGLGGQGAGEGQGTTTQVPGGNGDQGGGGGAAGTTGATAGGTGGRSVFGGGGGGGGTVSGTGGTGGVGGAGKAGGAAHASATQGTTYTLGGSGGGGGDATTQGGNGAQPGGGGGGAGNATNNGGNGADGAVTIVTYF